MLVFCSRGLSQFVHFNEITSALVYPKPQILLQRRFNVFGDAVLVLVTLLWGTTFLIVKDTVAHIAPAWFILIRFLLGALVLFPFWFRGPRKGLLRASLILGSLMYWGFATQTWALHLTGPNRVAFLTGTSVLLVPTFLWLFRGKKPHRSLLIGISAATIGMALLLLRPHGFNVGDFFGLVCAFIFAVQIIFTGDLSPQYDALALSAGQLMVVTVWAFLFTLNTALPMHAIFVAWPYVLYTSLVATAFTTLAQTWAQKKTAPSHAALIFTLEPLFAMLYTALMTGRLLTPLGWLGVLLIVGGTLYAEWVYIQRKPQVA